MHPLTLLQNLKHNKVLHEHNILLTLHVGTTPYIKDEQRLVIEELDKDFLRVEVHCGFMEQPNVVHAMLLLREKNIMLDMMSTSFFISRRNIVPSARFGMPLWRDRIYIAMANNASDAAEYFHIPQSRVVELGVQMTV